MEFGWFQEDETGLAEINITPLVDVALVLLIIFMITAPMLVQGASVDLPQTRPISKLPAGNIYVTVTAEGEYFLNDELTPLTVAELEERLIPLASLGQAIYVQGDTDALYGTVVQILAAAKVAGITSINMVTEANPNLGR